MFRNTRFFLLAMPTAAAFFMLASCGDDQVDQKHLLDLNGQAIDPLEESTATATVFLFTRADCPISNRYAPYVQRLHDTYAAKGVAFYLVYCDSDASAAVIGKHLKEYNYAMAALMDPHHVLVKQTGARITPEAVVYDGDSRLVYRGRIDDQYVDFGKTRAAPTKKDLEEVLEALVEGESVTLTTTEAIGCYIQEL